MSNLLTVSNLKKNYHEKPVLNNVSFSVPQHSIYAFLGNNGAGKSTTIRILMGLLKKDHGTITILDKEISHLNNNYRRDIGAIVDSPAHYQDLTGKENLLIHCYLKKVSTNDIDRVLKVVELLDAKHHKVSQYSLGMKQRLALAAALLGNPKLLILDEPTNGLDPKGMAETRELIKTLPLQTGATIFISSHLLYEVEKTASHVAILNRGEIVLESAIDCLDNNTGQLNLLVNQADEVCHLLTKLGYQTDREESLLKVPQLTLEQCAHINREIITNGYQLFNAQFKKTSLEQCFHQQVLS